MVTLPPEGTAVTVLNRVVMAAVLTIPGNWSAEAMVIAVTVETWSPSFRVAAGATIATSEEATRLKVVKVLAPAPVVTEAMINVISMSPLRSAAVSVVQVRVSALATSRTAVVPEPANTHLATAEVEAPPTVNVLVLELSAAVKYVAGVAMVIVSPTAMSAESLKLNLIVPVLSRAVVLSAATE